MAWLLDLDGVVWLAHQEIPGAGGAVARLRAAGERVLFVTNASMSTLGELERALAGVGIDAAGDVASSAMAAAALLEPGSTALVCGGPGAIEALERRGVEVRARGPVDAVVVGLTRHFDYDLLDRASRAVRDGARFVATNTDPTYPTPGGLTPGGGAVVAAVATASGSVPEVAGKPHPAMAALVRSLVGDGPHTMVGDQAATDLAFARALGARAALVLSGVTEADHLPTDPPADVVAADLATLVADALGGGGGAQPSKGCPPGPR
jgi:4-nitrophenyl phosphatase